MDVSVLISTWNNAKRLGITLDAFQRVFIPEGLTWQLIIVNNNCNDNTDEIIEGYKNKLPILYVNEPIQGLSRARNAGLKEATGKLIIFTDDDVEPCQDWINIYWKAFNNNQSDYILGGPIESEFENHKPDDELLSIAPSSVKGLDLGNQTRVLLDHEYFISANWAAPLKSILSNGGFDITKGLGSSPNRVSVGEEIDMMRKLCAGGLVRLYLPDARIRHYVPKEKSTLTHLLSRYEASAYQEYSKFNYKLKSWAFFQKPVGMYVHIIVNYSFYLFNRLFRKKYLKSYVEYRVAIVVAKEIEKNLSISKKLNIRCKIN